MEIWYKYGLQRYLRKAQHDLQFLAEKKTLKNHAKNVTTYLPRTLQLIDRLNWPRVQFSENAILIPQIYLNLPDNWNQIYCP